MKTNKDEKNESIESEEIEETSESKEKEEIKKTENNIVGIPVKYTRPPAFIKQGNMGRGNFKISNNRQRPGRAAGRGR